MSLPEFNFTDELLSGNPDCWGVLIPAGVNTREELFTLYDQRLSLPDYFGNNFDALDECLRDLSWIDPGTRVVVQHEDLPLAADAEQCTRYLHLLRDVVRDWQSRGAERLTVVFPVAVKGTVLSLTARA